MPKIFISYRREDCAAVAGRLNDQLRKRFGVKNVFRDVDGIKPGELFAEIIAERISTCDVLIALIGKNWLDAKDNEGRRRLEQPGDFVALEISEALVQNKVVFAVLIEDAPAPRREALPPLMRSLLDRNGVPLSDSRFDYDVKRLIGAINLALSFKNPLPELTPHELRNRRALLNDVKDEVTDRLDQSLHNAVLINLAIQKQPQQVRRPWDLEVKIEHQPSALLPLGTEIIDVFDQKGIAGRLLILGAPGIG